MFDEDYEYDEVYDEDDDACYGYEDATQDDTALHMTSAAVPAMADMQGQARTMAIGEALEMQASVVEDVARLTFLSPSAAALLLANYLWSKDVAVERYFEDPDSVLQRLSLTAESATHVNTLCGGAAGTETMCDICCMEYAPNEVLCLSSCQHFFCKECWQDHVKQHVHHNLLATRCPAQGCREVIGIGNMVALFDGAGAEATSPALRDIYREYLSSYVQSCPSLFWCPNPVGCTGIIHVEVPPLQGQGVTCDVCRHDYCLRCAGDPHKPATCDNMRKWRTYCTADGANIAFILVRTKPCPKCKHNIEKNGGCNHMTCKCGYEFCWMCGHDWKKHAGDFYSCKNAAEAPVVDDRHDARSSRRFMYHYERYTLHLDSAKRDVAFINSYASHAVLNGDAEDTTRSDGQSASASPSVANSAGPAPDTISLIKKALVAARPVIAHAYVQMFYLDDTTAEAMMMAHRVGKLEEATETLSGKIVDYFRHSKAQLGPMMDILHVVNNWQKVVCDAS